MAGTVTVVTAATDETESASDSFASESNSSSDEEESERLKLAVAGCFETTVASSTKSSTGTKSSANQIVIKPSLRNNAECNIGFEDNDLQVPAEVKAFLSKRFSTYMDSLISTEERAVREIESSKDLGIKLFKRSSISLNEEILEPDNDWSQKRSKKKRKDSSSSDSAEEEMRLREAAVSAEFVTLNAATLQTQGQKNDTENLKGQNKLFSKLKSVPDCRTNEKIDISGQQFDSTRKVKKMKKKKKNEKKPDFDGRASLEQEEGGLINVGRKINKCEPKVHAGSTEKAALNRPNSFENSDEQNDLTLHKKTKKRKKKKKMEYKIF